MSATRYSKLFLVAVMIFAAQMSVWGQVPASSLDTLIINTGSATTTYTTTYTVPAGVYALTLEAWGGGGGGGFVSSSNNGQTTGGGGGGAYAKSIISVTPGQVLTITVGGGGSGGNVAATAKAGGFSSVSRSGFDLVRAVGGGGAVNNNDTPAGAGGQASNCTVFSDYAYIAAIAYNGGNGGIGSGSGGGTGAGGGGGGAGSGGSGNKGIDGKGSNTGGDGGAATPDYGGSGGKGADLGSTWISSRGNGDNGSVYGGGGGGAKSAAATSADANGGNGAPGLVRISFASPPLISLAGENLVCPGDYPVLTATAPHPVRTSPEGWEWIQVGNSSGSLTSSPVFTAESLAPGTYTYKVRAHYNGVTWNSVTNLWVSDDSQNTVTFTVKPRTQTPQPRWNYDGTCPVDEGESDYLPEDSAHIATPWNENDPLKVYFANNIVWDSLVVNAGGDDIPLTQIRWYTDAACTQFIRAGLDPRGPMLDFFQNEPHPRKEYWATITHPDSCESLPIPVVVNIYDGAAPEMISVTDLVGYVQPYDAPSLDLLGYLNLNLDQTQHLEWYNFESDASNPAVSPINPAPSTLDPRSVIDKTYWLVKTDDYGCRSLPTPFRIRLVPMPAISITPIETLICPGERVNVTVTVANGMMPYKFKIVNMNSGDENERIVNVSPNNTYTFSSSPLSTVTYRITEFSDVMTPSFVTYPPYGLKVPDSGYFIQSVLKVIVTEITEITPNAGPTVGGTYTNDPDNPIDLNGRVTIIGSGFKPFSDSPVPSVTFGGVSVPVANITVVDNYTITCVPPAHASGDVTVAVATNCGTVTLTDGYHYEFINIAATDPSPAYAPVTGGTRITIQGTGLLASGVTDPLTTVTVTLAGVPARIISVTNSEIVCIAGPSNYSLLDTIVIYNGSETRKFPRSFTYYPVKFIENGKWSEPHRWETQTADHILPYPNAVIQIMANCLQDTIVEMDSITVHPSKAYTLMNDVELNANVFTLKENASFIDNNANSTNMKAVQQNVEHLLSKGRNWYVSSPTQGAVPPPTIASALGSARVQSYNEASNVWDTPPPTTTTFDTGKGYTANSTTSDIAVKFSGKYTDGNQLPLSLARTGTLGKSGFNLVGNPFPSYWQWTSESTQQTNLYSTIWYRTYVGGVYEFWSYNASGDVAVAPSWEDATPTGSYSLGYIPPMQAFWVRVLEGEPSGTLTFTDNRRAHADHGSNLLKSAEVNNKETRPLLRITADNGSSTDETVIYADKKAKKDFDTYDSDKWFVNQGVEIFTLPTSSTRELVINGLPEITDGMEIPLGFQANGGGTFNFRAKEILNLDTLDVFLSDKQRNMEFDLRSGDYNFTSSSVSGTDRFSILFRRSTSVGLPTIKADDDNLLVYTNTNGQMIVVLHLRNRQGSHANVSIFDITGRKLFEQSVVIGEHTTLHNTFPKGVYILRAEKYTAKVMVQR